MIGNYIKTDTKCREERVYTFSRICVEVDLSKGLPECIPLTHKQQKWTQHFDYENTAFRCRICRNTGHLQNTCPEAKRDNRTKKKTGRATKGWQYPSDKPEPNTEEDAREPTPEGNNQTTTETGTQEQEMLEPQNIAPTSLDQ